MSAARIASVSHLLQNPSVYMLICFLQPAAGTEFAVPILFAYDSSFQIRPEGKEFILGSRDGSLTPALFTPVQFGYHFSNELVNWSSLKRAGPNPRLTCKPVDRKAPLFRFSLFSKFYTDPKYDIMSKRRLDMNTLTEFLLGITTRSCFSLSHLRLNLRTFFLTTCAIPCMCVQRWRSSAR